MAETCICTLEPMEHGGVIAKVREVVSLHSRFGHDSHLLYTATNQVPTTGRWDVLRHLFTARPRWELNCGFRGFAVPDWPVPLWAAYALPLVAARRAIERAQMHVAVSGSNHCALPLALARKRFIVWIGTLYEEELIGRAAAGDRWAARMLNSPARAILAWEERLNFERASLILTNGAHTAQAVKRDHPATADRLRVMLYPVDTAIFHPEPTSRRAASRPYLLFTARINDPRKNVSLLFRAFAKARRSFPDLRLVLTGDPPGPDARRALEESGAGDAIEFVGYQTRESLIKLYQSAELFVLPSLQEGLGISMLEALACGLPVVSTRCGGPESVIADGETGRLVENNNAEAFADAIVQLLSNSADLEAMRERCAHVAVETFSKERTGQDLLSAFRDVYPEYFR